MQTSLRRTSQARLLMPVICCTVLLLLTTAHAAAGGLCWDAMSFESSAHELGLLRRAGGQNEAVSYEFVDDAGRHFGRLRLLPNGDETVRLSITLFGIAEPIEMSADKILLFFIAEMYANPSLERTTFVALAAMTPTQGHVVAIGTYGRPAENGALGDRFTVMQPDILSKNREMCERMLKSTELTVEKSRTHKMRKLDKN